MQCWLTQANTLEQSLFTTHSGRQPVYGSPKYSGRQLQMQELPLTRASALGPQGLGLQGSLGGGGAAKRKVNYYPKIVCHGLETKHKIIF